MRSWLGLQLVNNNRGRRKRRIILKDCRWQELVDTTYLPTANLNLFYQEFLNAGSRRVFYTNQVHSWGQGRSINWDGFTSVDVKK